MSSILTPAEIAVGGKGTKKITGPATVTGLIAALKLHSECPNLQLFREMLGTEEEYVEVTSDHFTGSTPDTDDFIKGFGYNFGKVVLDTDEVATLIFADTNNIEIA